MSDKSIPIHFETDLQELIAILWSQKIFVIIVSVCASFLALSYSLKLDKKYVAHSIL